jgi:UDP-GlcNAc:undecaprenyl-phosphate GlcNAc-1-phosphate transferase
VLIAAESCLRSVIIGVKGKPMNYIIACLVPFLLTALSTPLVARIATACNCMDVPGERRVHSEITPRWGGVAFFAGVLPVLFYVNDGGSMNYCLVSSFLLVAIGALDDLRELGWKSKFIATGVAAAIVTFGGHAVVRIGGSVELGWLSVPFTCFGIIGLTNAINLLDGLNGLAGGVSLLGFLFMGVAALFADNVLVAVVCFAFVGALAGFLIYNFPHARIFMGDSGSILLGFFLSLMAIMLTQAPGSAVNPLFPVVVLLLPLFDTIRVLFVRLLNGRNPFLPDNLHLHYLIAQMLSPVKTVLLLWSFTVMAGGTALFLLDLPATTHLAAILYGCLGLAGLAGSLMRRAGHMQTNDANGRRQLIPRKILLSTVASFGRSVQNSSGVRARSSRRVVSASGTGKKPLKRSS